MKKVLFVAPVVKNRYKGGISRIVEMLSTDAVKVLFDVNLVDIEFFNSEIIKRAKNTEGRFRLLNVLQIWLLFLALFKKVISENHSVVHFNTSSGLPLLKDQLVFFTVSLARKKKYYLHIHYGGIEATLLRGSLRGLQLYLLNRLDGVVVLSETFRAELVSAGVQRSKVFVLYNFHNYSVKNKIVNTSILGIKLLFIGSISKRKGFYDLLYSLKSLNIDYELNVLGDFESYALEEDVKHIVSEANLNVNFLGYLNGKEKELVLTMSDILVLPSYGEGFPMVIPEAMAFGCAILASNVAAIPEIICNGYNGFLIKPGDVLDLSDKIKLLHFDFNLLNCIKSNNLASASNFGVEKFVNDLCIIYK
jgi:glycosyltransferase involved in cell wall biosynthesis